MNGSETRFTLQLDGREIDLPPGEATIGRSRGCTVTLKDTSVSRNHAVVEVLQGVARLTDLGSSNGTYVNGHRLQGSTELADGDRVTIGETDLRFHCHRPEPEVMETLRIEPDDTSPPAPPPPALGRTTRLGSAAAPPARSPEAVPPPPAVLPPVPPAAGRQAAAPPLPPPVPAAPAAPQRRPATPAPPPAAPASVSSVPPAAPAAAQELLPSIDDMDLAALPPAPAPTAGPAPRAAAPAGFWIRFVALVIDTLLLMAVSVGSSFALGGPLSPRGSLLSSVVSGVLGLFVPVVGWAAFGTTPGKRLLGLYVVTVDGRCPIGFVKAILRLVGYLLSFLSLGIGFLMVGLTAAKRGLHDLIAGTYVARR